MQLTLELITKGFVSSFEEEEYEFTKIFYNEEDLDKDDGDEAKADQENSPDDEREIFEDEDHLSVREFV